LQRPDLADAANHFREAIRLDQKAPALRINLATAMRQVGDDDGEEASLRSVLALDQRDFIAWLRLAELQQRRGQTGPALQSWTIALRLSEQIEHPSPELKRTLSAAQLWVKQQNERFGALVDVELQPRRSSMPPSALRRFDACADAVLGRRQIYHNQCEGVHFPFLPPDEFFEEHHFPWLADIEARTDLIREELLSVLTGDRTNLEPYVQQEKGLPKNIWSELDGSLDWSAFFLWNYGLPIQAACARCPHTAAALDLLPRIELPSRAPTAFFSILRPHTHIPAHTGVTNTRAIVHLPLIVPTGCRFRVGGTTRPWITGKAIVFDDTIEHEAWNDSDEIRAVLIFDVWNPHITDVEKSMLNTLFHSIDRSEYNPGISQTR
jgi:aspartyl/asparaginyl beta-hydroxylase (cupin superfamily)